jgi:hypothetical protein
MPDQSAAAPNAAWPQMPDHPLDFGHRPCRDAAVLDRLIVHLEGLIDGSDAWSKTSRDELVGTLKTKPGLRRYLRRTGAGGCASTGPPPTAKPTSTANGCCALPT